MFYCGLDVAMSSSFVYVVDSSGRRVASGAVPTEESALGARLRRFVRSGLAVAIEAGNQSSWIYEVLVKLGARVTVVNPAKLRLIAESRCKTDKVDAKILAELLRLDGLPRPVHVPSKAARDLRELLTARRQLVSLRTKLCNFVRGLLRQYGLYLPARALTSGLGWQRLLADGFPGHVPHVALIVTQCYENYGSLTSSIKSLERELAAREKQDPRAELLRSMPKVGRIGALTFLAAVDDIHRFSSSRKLVGYSGLAPTVRSSGERTQYGSITRQGRRELRAVWVQIAHLVAVDESKAARPLRRWFLKVAKKRGYKTAVVALARRLLTIAYHLVREEEFYDERRLQRKRVA